MKECTYPSNDLQKVVNYSSISPPLSHADKIGRLVPVAFNLPQIAPTLPTNIQQFGETLQQASEENSARNREYDEMFKKDAQDRDKYYGKMALESMKRAEKLERDQKQELKAFLGIAYPVDEGNKDAKLTIEKQLLAFPRAEDTKESLSAPEFIEEIKNLRDQQIFEARINALDRFEASSENK
eukprot:CAMPEP_0113321290 /NCGR_PEP_ID=MMETSP0010_2-20120614/14820_1 /TAXON_ID=216773 ORGANISM="Corethron hystrix, Strain 308" /NCGR_SAMPLE_ID=MMETSP0010_2 /ASSEMBLY_ACC=CAM_ASM_000155 /LENGTH=182 /DNA_ID=CAMNT_0000179367 /DNA_START=250 /DNA_END=798 /DNA_ORIENTATION=- /assembly_acc=CAM_ASM_000155